MGSEQPALCPSSIPLSCEGPACAAESEQGRAAQQLVKLFALHDRLWELMRRSHTHKAKALPGVTQVDPLSALSWQPLTSALLHHGK